ncbi:hypothetical protein ACIBCN_19430 [Nocardia sp. NPDC051052]|uniref:hypothetical protein n=1 Tax=Nocardia sp. NPDC051052 TaxID=3364322 RepID=UPI0037A5B4A1
MRSISLWHNESDRRVSMKHSMFGSAVVAAGATVLVGMAAVAHAAPPSDREPTASIGESVELADSGLEVTVHYSCQRAEVNGLVLLVEQTSGGEKVVGGAEAEAECDGSDQTKKFTIASSKGGKFRSGEVEVTLEMDGEDAAVITEKRTIK